MPCRGAINVVGGVSRWSESDSDSRFGGHVFGVAPMNPSDWIAFLVREWGGGGFHMNLNPSPHLTSILLSSLAPEKNPAHAPPGQIQLKSFVLHV